MRVCCVVSQFKCFVKENQSKMCKKRQISRSKHTLPETPLSDAREPWYSSYDRLILFDDLSCIALNKEMVKKMVSLINYSSKLVVLLS